MARWIVDVPKASAKRLETDRRLVVEIHTAFTSERREWPIPAGEDMVAYDFEYQENDPNEDILDASVYYNTYIEYRNSTGSRVEKIAIKPETV